MRRGDLNEADEADEVPPLATRVATLLEAVEISLRSGLDDQTLFIFARALKAFEITTRIRLSAQDLGSAFAEWWNRARPRLPADADFDEYRFDFLDRFEATNAALGANPFHEAVRLADSKAQPPEAARYQNPRLRRLVAVCYYLQHLNGSSPFFMAIRNAAEILGSEDPKRGNRALKGLVRDGILIVVEPGVPGKRKATRYRFVS
jgi:hypothetical protein